MRKTLHFSINSQGIMDAARETLYHDNDFPKALRMLSESLSPNPEEDPDTMLLTWLKVLDGQLDLHGTYPEEDIKLVPTDTSGKILAHLEKMHDRIVELEQEHDKSLEILSAIHECVPQTYLNQVNNKMGEVVFPKDTNDILGTILQAMSDTGQDFGYLAPDGTWYDVDFGRHEAWAHEYLEKHPELTSGNPTRITYCADYLVQRLHFCLVHAPSVHEIVLTHQGLTKKQKDFLYDYFTKRNMTDRAIELYNEE